MFVVSPISLLNTGVYLTIIPRTRVGYEVIDSQRGAKRRVGYNHLISNKREWNNCFIKNHQQILLDFANFAWLEQPEGSLMDAISRVWYNGSYTIAAKLIKTLKLHYTVIQFLINLHINQLQGHDGWILTSFFFACLWTSTASQSINMLHVKRTRLISNYIDLTLGQ